MLQSEPIGVQVVVADGTVARRVPPGDIELNLAEDVGDWADSGGDEVVLWTETTDGASYRVLSVDVAEPEGGFLRLIHPLESVEDTMTSIAWLLAAVSAVGVAVAGGLGFVTARAGLRPVDRLVDAAERVAETGDLDHRIDVRPDDNDEVARLATSVNAMLTALDAARTQQRELVENASHELRTPLATLRNDIGLLRRLDQYPDRRLSGTDRSQLLGDLETEAEALSVLVAEVVDLARGDIEPEPLVETDLRHVADRAVARTSRSADHVDVVVRGRGLEAVVRPAALERAVANLVRNAVQVSPAGGPVQVELTSRDSWVEVDVLDRGPGIADADLPHLFDRFFRGAGARDRPGSGLGLAIVAQVADLHGGTVTADNRPGGGAAFSLRVPIAPITGS